ncbi:MAG: hypothetical protein ORN21_06115 [Methylophilaceae bacterium]|nr:hypothetical protein [Methylophilaceae bacterium]
MKKQLAVMGVLMSLTINSWADGIPVIDYASIARLVMQYEQHQLTNQNLLYQLNAIVGNRGMGQVANNPTYRTNPPTDIFGRYDNMQQGGLAMPGVSPTVFDTYNRRKVYGCEQQFPNNPSARINCEQHPATASVNLDDAKNALQKSQARTGQLQSLLDQVDKTQDLKAAADLQNRILLEIAFLQNEKANLDNLLAYKKAQAEMNDVISAEKLNKPLGTYNPFNFQ